MRTTFFLGGVTIFSYSNCFDAILKNNGLTSKKETVKNTIRVVIRIAKYIKVLIENNVWFKVREPKIIPVVSSNIVFTEPPTTRRVTA